MHIFEKVKCRFYLKSWTQERMRICLLFLWRIVAGLLALRDLFFLVSRGQIFLNI